MITPEPADVTGLLRAWRGGDQEALERLAAVVYDELRRIARRYMRNERDSHTLQATALVNEVWLRLVDVEERRLAASGPVLRHLRADDAAHPGGCGPRPALREARRRCGQSEL